MLHDSVIAEFGGSLADDDVEAEAGGDEVVAPDPYISSGTMTVHGIQLEVLQSPRHVARRPRSLVSLSLHVIGTG